EGGIILQNLDTNNGSITIGSNVTLNQANNSPLAFGEIDIFIGSTNPTNLTSTTAPSGLNVSATNGGQFLIGNNSIFITGNNPATITGGTLKFDTNTRPTSAISLGGGVTITSNVNIPLITSFDLTQTADVNLIESLQSQHKLGGDLALQNTIIVGPLNFRQGLTAFNVTPGVIVTAQDFGAGKNINISIGSSSSTKQPIVSG